MIIREIVLKVTSFCNLNCTYCYVFNKGDFSYKNEPKFVQKEVIEKLFYRIEEYASITKIDIIKIIFHGGEPLLLSKQVYKEILNASKNIIKSTKISFVLQSNATLMTKDWADFFIENNINVGFSIDFTLEGSKERIFKNGNIAYNEILKGINEYEEIKGYSSLLSVINSSIEPEEIYQSLKTEINNLNAISFLLPHENHETSKVKEGVIGAWLVELFNIWHNDKTRKKPKIVLPFYPLMKKIIGVEQSGNEMFGENKNAVLNIKTDGRFALVDSLKICGDGFTKTQYNIFDHSIMDFFNDDNFIKYYNSHDLSVLPQDCSNCSIREICGGGHIGHRYSKNNGFNNKSVYCTDMKMIITHIQNIIYESLPENIIRDTDIQKINYYDL